MEAALGVLKGKQLGEQRVLAEEDRAFEVGKRDRESAAAERRALLDAETLRSRVLGNEDILSERDDRAARAAAAERAKKIRYDGLLRIGYKPEEATEIVEADFNARELTEKAKKAELDRARQAAEVERVKAQAARDRVEAAAGTRADRAAITSATREATTRRREMQSLLTRRPRESQFVDPLTKTPNAEGYAEALLNWRADSTDRKGAEEDAAAELQRLVPGAVAPRPATAPAPASPSGPPPTDDEIDEAIAALEEAGKQPTTEAVKVEILRRRGAR
jgi:hypothetical protein